ncbi:MAG: response regulator [Candidatus Omnitrophota bacterium]
MAKKILVVDDDMDFKEAVKMLLEAKGYEVITACDGQEGIKKAKEEQPALILLDVMMVHKTEGFETARKIKEDETLKNIPVILTTGIKKSMNLPFNFEADETWLPVKTVLEKPIKPEALLAEVEKYVKK